MNITESIRVTVPRQFIRVPDPVVVAVRVDAITQTISIGVDLSLHRVGQPIAVAVGIESVNVPVPIRVGWGINGIGPVVVPHSGWRSQSHRCRRPCRAR